MKNLQEATEMICDLKGSLVAMDALVTALLDVLPAAVKPDLLKALQANAEVARTVMINTPISEFTVVAFERDIQRTTTLIGHRATPP
jgi:hypothetical protein